MCVLYLQAVRALKRGGVLVYSTCTLTLAENEEQVAWALRTFPGLTLLPQVRRPTTPSGLFFALLRCLIDWLAFPGASRGGRGHAGSGVDPGAAQPPPEVPTRVELEGHGRDAPRKQG